jgi:CRP/FNR family transcriptional regulator, cyclic AMP receptor protein
MAEITSILAEHPFAVGLSDDHLEALAACSDGEVSWDTGVSVLVTGERAEHCYLVVSGSLTVSTESPGVGSRNIQTVHGGGVLGLSWMFPPYRWIFDSVTLEPTTAVSLDAARLRDAIDARPDFGIVVVTKLASYLYGLVRNTRLQLLDLYGNRG